ncbi:MAG: translation initiation factor [Bacteroidota bacterium]|nr:translation initiation factor [Bacteroidota bacterium]
MSKKKFVGTAGIVYSTNPTVVNVASEAEEVVTLPASQQCLTVKLDAKQRGGKLVTLVNGFTGAIADLEKLGKELKSFCGTGGSVKNNEILIQGDNKEKALQWLHKNGYSGAKKA